MEDIRTAEYTWWLQCSTDRISHRNYYWAPQGRCSTVFQTSGPFSCCCRICLMFRSQWSLSLGHSDLDSSRYFLVSDLCELSAFGGSSWWLIVSVSLFWRRHARWNAVLPLSCRIARRRCRAWENKKIMRTINQIHLLCHQEISFLILKELIKFQNIGVIELFQDVDFSQQLFLLVFRQIFFADDLDRTKRFRFLVKALSHFSVCAYNKIQNKICHCLKFEGIFDPRKTIFLTWKCQNSSIWISQGKYYCQIDLTSTYTAGYFIEVFNIARILLDEDGTTTFFRTLFLLIFHMGFIFFHFNLIVKLKMSSYKSSAI